MSAPEKPARPADLVGRVLFEPLATLLPRFARLPSPAELNRTLAATPPAASAPSDVRLPRFVAAETLAYQSYEGHIARHGEVPTRSANWHDFFNALAWHVWPRSKAALNTAHSAALAAQPPGAPRGPRRDALTQFDECGLLVVSSDAAVLDALARHAWREVFCTARAGLAHTTRFLVFGHALWDQLRQPFHSLCAKSLHRQVSATWFELPAPARHAELDRWLAGRILAPACLTRPRDLYPLPVLGIPGVTPASENPAYYDDVRQFRPKRSAAAGMPASTGAS